MISKSEVHNKIFESELVQLENDYEKWEINIYLGYSEGCSPFLWVKHLI